jgi:2-hydroxychromene-2-carboxylate isomerase
VTRRQEIPRRRPHSIIRRDVDPDGSRTGQTSTQLNDQPVIVYGAFSSARSYLASGRVALLEADGLYVDWRIVGDRTGFGIQPTDLERFEATRREMERVVSALLPGERLPYSLAGSLCRTGAAAAGYAQAYDLGVASPIRRLLFEALWVQGVDLDDEKSIRTLILDRLPGLSDVGTGSPTHDDQSARSLISQWAWEWDCLGRPPLPAMAVEGRVRRCGDEAVTWFETQLMHRDVEIGSERSGAGKAGQPECLDLIPRARSIGAPHRPGFPPKGRTRSKSPVI